MQHDDQSVSCRSETAAYAGGATPLEFGESQRSPSCSCRILRMLQLTSHRTTELRDLTKVSHLRRCDMLGTDGAGIATRDRYWDAIGPAMRPALMSFPPLVRNRLSVNMHVSAMAVHANLTCR